MHTLTRRLVRRAVCASICLALLQVAAQAAPNGDKPGAEKTTIPVFRLQGAIGEGPSDASFLFGSPGATSLKDLVVRLAKARDDDGVKAVVIILNGASLGNAQVEEVRQSIRQLRAAGKEVFAHADGLSMADYVLLSGATQISLAPTADLWLTGMYAESPYLKGLLNKLGIAPDFLTCGDYKSAAEIYMRDGPSPQAEEMQNWLLDGIFENQVAAIATGRGVTVEKARDWIDGGPYTAEKARDAGLIDVVQARQDFEAALKARFGEASVKFDRRYGAQNQTEIDLSSPFGAMSLWTELLSGGKKKVHKDSVAIVYVDGAISLGGGGDNPLMGVTGATSDAVRKAMDEAADDDTIKAVVLRVNSPGGSATASDIILDATKRVKAKKPFVVSMGDVAGSGGYYVACGADVIFANEATITGSIGVVGGKLATTGLWDKVGIRWKSYQRGANAPLLSSAHGFNEGERARMQAWMDEIYGVFKGHVTAIRADRLKKPIDELAGGRVYTGRQALELGLIDKIGTLGDAIKHAANEAGMDRYELRVVPEPKNLIEQLLERASGDRDDGKHVLQAVRSGLAPQGHPLLEAALPYLQQLDPHRLSAVRMALLRLDMLQKDGAVLMMPEIVVGR